MVVAEAGVPKRFAFGSRDCDLVISDYSIVNGYCWGGCCCVGPLRGLKESETRKPLNAGWAAARLSGAEGRG